MGRRTARAFTLRLQARKLGRGGGVLQGGAVLVGPYRVAVDDPALDADLELQVDAYDGRLAISELVLRRRPGRPAPTVTTLRRVALDSYLAQSLAELPPGQLGSARSLNDPSKPAPTDEDGEPRRHMHVSPARGQQQRQLASRTRRVTPRPRDPAGRLGQLQQVAGWYRDALQRSPEDDPDGWRRKPTEYVAFRLGGGPDGAKFSRGHAGKLLTQARTEGLLAPALRGQAGEEEQR